MENRPGGFTVVHLLGAAGLLGLVVEVGSGDAEAFGLRLGFLFDGVIVVDKGSLALNRVKRAELIRGDTSGPRSLVVPCSLPRLNQSWLEIKVAFDGDGIAVLVFLVGWFAFDRFAGKVVDRAPLGVYILPVCRRNLCRDRLLVISLHRLRLAGAVARAFVRGRFLMAHRLCVPPVRGFGLTHVAFGQGT